MCLNFYLFVFILNDMGILLYLITSCASLLATDSMQNILIITHAPQGTLGDASAAAKLQQLLLQDFNAKVAISVAKEHEEPVKKLFGEKKPYQLINQLETTGQKAFKKMLFGSKLVIAYPTPHFLGENSVTTLAKKGVPVISVGEYDYDIEYRLSRKAINITPGSLFLNSGLGKECLGIYIDEFDTPPKAPFKDQIHPADREKLPVDLLEEDHQLYFGYFNRLFESTGFATAPRFIALSLLMSSQKQVDIILPLQAFDAPGVSKESRVNSLLDADFIKEMEGFRKVAISYSPPSPHPLKHLIYQWEKNKFIVRNVQEDEFAHQKHSAEKIVRIINPFPLHKRSMVALTRLSEPVNLLTGDQSFSEALSLLKIPFYQIMPWKKKFYTALINAAEGADALQTWLKMMDNQTVSVKALAEFYHVHQEDLAKDMKQLRDFIAENKNFSLQFLNFLETFLNSSRLERFKLFVEQMKQNPKHYVNQRGYDGKCSILTTGALLAHLNFYLKAGDSEEKNEMMNYFFNSGLMTSVAEGGILESGKAREFWFYSSLKDMHPDLKNPFDADSIVEWARLTFGVGREIAGNEDVSLTTIPLRIILQPLTSIDIRQFTPAQILSVLQYMMSFKAVSCSMKGVNLMGEQFLINILKNKPSKEVLNHLLQLIFATPCYINDIDDETFFFDDKSPSLFFLMTDKGRASFSAQLLNNPEAIEALFDLLFDTNNPPIIGTEGVKINDLVLKELLFPDTTTRRFRSLFQPWPQKTPEEKELARKLLEVTGHRLSILEEFLLKHKSDLSSEQLELYQSFTKSYGKY